MLPTVKEEQVCRDEWQWKDCFAPEVKCFLPAGQIPLEATTGCGFLPHLHRLWKSIRSDDPRAPTVTSAPQYLPGATADIVLDPISNKTSPLTVCFVFNKSAWQCPHIPVALRMGIYHSTIDQIWHTSSCAGNSWGGYTHTVDLLTWYTGQSKVKYVPWDISHLSWNCHKLIFTTRTSRNWKRGNTVASWPCKQSSGLKVSFHLSTHRYLKWKYQNFTLSVIEPQSPISG